MEFLRPPNISSAGAFQGISVSGCVQGPRNGLSASADRFVIFRKPEISAAIAVRFDSGFILSLAHIT